MNKQDIDLDTSHFKGELADGTFLTKAEYDFTNKRIDATYHKFIKGEDKGQVTVHFFCNYFNYTNVTNEKYSSIIKLIEINDNELYKKLEELDDRLKKYKLKYSICSCVSFFSALAGVTFGYGLVNAGDDIKSMLPILLSSAAVMFIGILSKKEELLNKLMYDYEYDDMIDIVEERSINYVRIKK